MKNISVVIGANYGDEGKGLMTDYLCRQVKDPLVVRFNGGSQAGHTVTDELGRFVFSHLSAGTLAGASTYLTEHFICNPIKFNEELQAVLKRFRDNKKAVPFFSIYVHEFALVTTPYEQILNQLVETSRGGKKHGSCGHGIYETIRRDTHSNIDLTVGVVNRKSWLNRLEEIRYQWFPQRAKELGLPDDKIAEIVDDTKLYLRYLDDVREFMRFIKIVEADKTQFISNFDLIFEGAQGLALDQNAPGFPHLTPSNTGLPNVLEVLDNSLEEEYHLDLYYMTRAYMTRHGAGQFPSENPRIENLINNPEETNQFNQWQDSLRYGSFNIQEYESRITKDLNNLISRQFHHYTSYKVVTCLDQIKPAAIVTYQDSLGRERQLRGREYCDMLRSYASLVSVGPTYKGLTDPVEGSKPSLRPHRSERAYS